MVATATIASGGFSVNRFVSYTDEVGFRQKVIGFAVGLLSESRRSVGLLLSALEKFQPGQGNPALAYARARQGARRQELDFTHDPFNNFGPRLRIVITQIVHRPSPCWGARSIARIRHFPIENRRCDARNIAFFYCFQRERASDFPTKVEKSSREKRTNIGGGGARS